MDDIKNAFQIIAMIIASVIGILTGIEKTISILINYKELKRK